MDKTPQDRPTEPQKSGTNRIWIFLLFFLLLLFIFNSANQPPVAKYSDLETWLSIPAKPGNRARDIVGRDAIELVTIDQQTNQAVIKFKKDESNPIKVLPIGSKVETEVDVVQVVIPDAEGTSDLKTLLDGEGKDQQFAKIPYQYSPQDGTASIIMFIAIMLPIAILIFFWISYRRSQNQFMGGGCLLYTSPSPRDRR